MQDWNLMYALMKGSLAEQPEITMEQPQYDNTTDHACISSHIAQIIIKQCLQHPMLHTP